MMSIMTEQNRLLEKQLMRLAVEVQSACNIIAVSSQLAVTTKTLRSIGYDSPGINQHSAVVLLVAKLEELAETGITNYDTYSKAYAACKEA
jgi:hypothetical protein